MKHITTARAWLRKQRSLIVSMCLAILSMRMTDSALGACVFMAIAITVSLIAYGAFVIARGAYTGYLKGWKDEGARMTPQERAAWDAYMANYPTRLSRLRLYMRVLRKDAAEPHQRAA